MSKRFSPRGSAARVLIYTITSFVVIYFVYFMMLPVSLQEKELNSSIVSIFSGLFLAYILGGCGLFVLAVLMPWFIFRIRQESQAGRETLEEIRDLLKKQHQTPTSYAYSEPVEDVGEYTAPPPVPTPGPRRVVRLR